MGEAKPHEDEKLVIEMQAQLEDEKRAKEEAMDSAVSRDKQQNSATERA